MSSSALIWMTVGLRYIINSNIIISRPILYCRTYNIMQSLYSADPQKIIIGMVGLPARGKSYISKKIYRYLNWLGFNTEVFNIGNYRRKYMSDNNIDLTVDFFNQQNQKFTDLRQKIACLAVDDLVDYLNKPENKVAILDGTNTTPGRRKNVAQTFKQRIKTKYQLIWVQSICDDADVIANNIKKVKVHGLDYAHMTSQQAQEDFQSRIARYQLYYKQLDKDQGFPYVKIINVGSGIETHNINGYLPEKIRSYVINLTLSPNRIIYLSRHGESLYNTQHRIGGDPDLSADGWKFAQALPKIFDDPNILENKQKAVILTSTLKRTIQTASFLKLNEIKQIPLRVLDELNAGICEELTYDQIKQKHPVVAKQRECGKLTFRYPSGESYMDVIGRLQPLIYWIERQKQPIILFGHQAILRCISAYFFGIQLNKIPYIEVPLHTIIKMTPQTYSFKQEYINVDVETGEYKCSKVIRKKYSVDYDGTRKFKQNVKNKFDNN